MLLTGLDGQLEKSNNGTRRIDQPDQQMVSAPRFVLYNQFVCSSLTNQKLHIVEYMYILMKCNVLK